MKLSTRVRYGVRAMIELAKQPENKPVSLKVVAKIQGISNKYLEQMFAELKVAGLVESIRGAEGGYRLQKSADAITVWDIYYALDIAHKPIDCTNPPCKRIKFCSAQEVWGQMTEAIMKVLSSHTLAQLAKQELVRQQAVHDAAPLPKPAKSPAPAAASPSKSPKPLIAPVMVTPKSAKNLATPAASLQKPAKPSATTVAAKGTHKKADRNTK